MATSSPEGEIVANLPRLHVIGKLRRQSKHDFRVTASITRTTSRLESSGPDIPWRTKYEAIQESNLRCTPCIDKPLIGSLLPSTAAILGNPPPAIFNPFLTKTLEHHDGMATLSEECKSPIVQLVQADHIKALFKLFCDLPLGPIALRHVALS
jgi:hypothetical protein